MQPRKMTNAVVGEKQGLAEIGAEVGDQQANKAQQKDPD